LDIYQLLTPVTYWLLIVMWAFILFFLLRRYHATQVESRLLAVLIAVLAVDALRTLFEGLFFSAWFTSLAGFLPIVIHDFLVRPEWEIVPRYVNVVSAAAIIGILMWRWYPAEKHDLRQQKELLIQRTAELTRTNQQLQKEIVERVRAAKELQEQAGRLDMITEQIPAVLWTTDSDLRFTSSEGRGLRALGLRPGQVVGMSLFDYFGTGDPEFPAIAAHLCALQGEASSYEQKWKEHTYESRVEPLSDASGAVVGTVGLALDITERGRAEEDIRKFKTIADNATYGVSIGDTEGKLIYANEAYANMHGYTVDELVGQHFTSLYAENQLDFMKKRRERILQTGTSAVDEVWHKRKDGSVFPTLVTGTAVKDEKGNSLFVAATHFDISERKKMEAQLLVTNRLSSIGELASGIAHELNNPLTSIIGFSDLLLGRELPDDVKEDLTIINTEAQRTAKIVKNLLSFARSRAPEEKSVSVNDAIGKILELRAYEQKVNDIEVTTRFAADLPEVTADEFQLQQVFLNLVINAEYFMKLAHDRGTLVIITERAGDVVRVSFADDGPGIAPESLPRLFDPFFTTKEVGKGTGLGLSICHGIISAHGGKIYAESELGKGATFFVELPIGKPWFSQLGSGEVKSRQDEAKDDAG
jgi:PAS domain S-box-containing protein